MKRIIIIQPTLAHYRQSFFEHLVHNNTVEIRFIAGTNYLNIKEASNICKTPLNFITLKLFSHHFYYLKNSLRELKKFKPDIVVCGGLDFHLLHTLIIFFYCFWSKNISFFWWTQATEGNQGSIGISVRKWFYKRSNGILTYCDKGKRNLLKWGIAESKIKVIRNSIVWDDYGYLNHNLKEKKKMEIFNIIFSGRINKDRKLDILLRSLYILKNKKQTKFNCTIIGKGNVKYLKKLVKDLNLDTEVNFIGEIYNKEISKYFLNADIMVYPKAIGLSIVHALSFGLPVITTDNIKIQMPEIELLKPGINGDFYKDEDEEDLSEKILLWKKKINSQPLKITNDCIDSVIKYEYLPDKMAEKFISFIG